MWYLPVALAFPTSEHAFISYGAVPTWTGVASSWTRERPRVDAYDTAVYKGHAEFVSRGLQTGLSFKQFKAAVRGADRSYVPFFLYDLTGLGVEVDGRACTWAVRIEDYSYADDDASLGKTAARLADEIARTWDLPVNSGLVVLARSQTVRPNEASAPWVTAAGYVHATLGVLQERAPTVEVLNPGIAVGTLRSGDDPHPGPHDIVLYTELPQQVPPVAAVLTVAPQTPLSHVNLLARNRGTPNVVVRDPKVVGELGRLVRLEAGETLKITPIPRAEAEAWWASHQPPAVELPRADASAGMFELTQRPTVEQVGAKAANYGLLQSLLPNTRPGWALGFRAYHQHVGRGPTEGLIRALVAAPPADPVLLGAQLAAIRHTIESTPLDPAVVASVRAVIGKLGVARIRLRSSTNNEDLPHFNGAGLYTSKGFDTEDSDAKLEKKLKQVFASLWTEHAWAERSFHGVDHLQVEMAVLIHEAFVDEQANGVALTVPTADGTTLIVNAQPLEHSVANPEPGVRPEALRIVGGRTTFDGESTIGPVFAGPYAHLLPALEHSVRIAHEALIAARIAEGDAVDYGVDVEFKVIGEAIVLKQARLLAPPRIR